MTEAEWLQGTNPTALFWHLDLTQRVLQFKAGRRKARLLACAWCRPLLAWLPGDWGASVVELVERFADGLLSKVDLAAVREFAREKAMPAHTAALSDDACQLASWAAWAVSALPVESSRAVLGNVGYPLTQAARLAPSLPCRCDAIREVFGNPFRPATLAPAWRRWNGGAARKLAEAIYENRAFGEAPVLADALEDAGCADGAVLAHLRAPGPHVRGCWAIDLILNRGWGA